MHCFLNYFFDASDVILAPKIGEKWDLKIIDFLVIVGLFLDWILEHRGRGSRPPFFYTSYTKTIFLRFDEGWFGMYFEIILGAHSRSRTLPKINPWKAKYHP